MNPASRALVIRITIKTLLLFIVLNLLAALSPSWLSTLGSISLYNSVFPGRTRLPFGETPEKSYNLSLFNLNAMISSHEVSSSGDSKNDEYKVFLFGDSSIWGTLLKPGETLAGQINSQQAKTCDNRLIRAYNLGYPTISLVKDLMLMDQTEKFAPDLIIWGLTLQAFPHSKQLATPLAANNFDLVQKLILNYGLNLSPDDPAFVKKDFFERTIVAERRSLADLVRLQIFGIAWAATGIDQDYPANWPPAQVDFEKDESFLNNQPGADLEKELSWDILRAGVELAGKDRILLLNEPILISAGKNSNVRYNFFYPRWAYDEYRRQLSALSQKNGWNMVDPWDLIPATEFTNSAIHLTPAGEKMLAKPVIDRILQQACQK